MKLFNFICSLKFISLKVAEGHSSTKVSSPIFNAPRAWKIGRTLASQVDDFMRPSWCPQQHLLCLFIFFFVVSINFKWTLVILFYFQKPCGYISWTPTIPQQQHLLWRTGPAHITHLVRPLSCLKFLQHIIPFVLGKYFIVNISINLSIRLQVYKTFATRTNILEFYLSVFWLIRRICLT